MVDFPFLRNHRGKPIQPNRIAATLAPWFRSMAELCDALGRETCNPKWHDVATALDAAALALRALA